MVAVTYIDWLLCVTSLKPWLNQSLHGGLESLFMLSRFIVSYTPVHMIYLVEHDPNYHWITLIGYFVT